MRAEEGAASVLQMYNENCNNADNRLVLFPMSPGQLQVKGCGSTKEVGPWAVASSDM